MQSGDSVWIVGLKNRLDLNERKVTLVDYNDQIGRWSVLIPSEPGEGVNILLANLTNINPIYNSEFVAINDLKTDSGQIGFDVHFGYCGENDDLLKKFIQKEFDRNGMMTSTGDELTYWSHPRSRENDMNSKVNKKIFKAMESHTRYLESGKDIMVVLCFTDTILMGIITNVSLDDTPVYYLHISMYWKEFLESDIDKMRLTPTPSEE